jgi:hypothetical protein
MMPVDGFRLRLGLRMMPVNGLGLGFGFRMPMNRLGVGLVIGLHWGLKSNYQTQ